MAKVSKQRKAEAIAAALRELCPPGTTVYTVLRGVSRSGMSCNIDCYVISAGGEPRWISRLAADAAGFTFNERRECIRVGGCGMDMGFHIVYGLSHALYPDGFGCIGDASGNRSNVCPSNDHSNGDRDYTPHSVYEHDKAQHAKLDKPPSIKPHWHRDGGYALRHRWL